MRSPAFYQRHLEAVSRSFALCIPQLEGAFREQVALAYLLLRVLDTVEDAPFADRQLQQLQFLAFRGFLREMPTRAQLEEFRAALPRQITDGERQLIDDTGALLEDAHELPASVRKVILDAIDRMAEGMAAYGARPLPLRLVDLEDVTRYCCIVAGLVGELLTRLWAAAGKPSPRMLIAYRFGLFLQKVNILKDQADDEATGRFLVPDRREVLASLRADAEGALAYLTSLPRAERGYRVFCAWALMLGAASLSQMEATAAAREGGPRASRRPETMALLGHTAEIAQDDEALRRRFQELLPRLPESRGTAPLAKPESAEQFARILGASLSGEELAELGAVLPGSRRVGAPERPG